MANSEEAPEERKLDESHMKFWEDRVQQYELQVKHLENLKEQTLEDIEENKTSLIPELVETIKTCETDIKKFNLLIESLEDRISKMKTKMGIAQKENEDFSKEIQELEKEQMYLQNAIDKQDLSVKDVEQMNSEKKNLQD